MNKEIAEKWATALESGKYAQGVHALRNNREEYCCLGVLCELAVEAGIIEPAVKQGVIYEYAGSHAVLPPKVKQWAEMDTHVGGMTDPMNRTRSLTAYNDGTDFYEPRKRNFNEIAQIIRENVGQL